MKRNVSIAIGALIFIVVIIFGIFIFGGSDKSDTSPDENLDISNTNSDSSNDQEVSPSVKIESATATLKEEVVTSSGSYKTCTVTLSGTVTGPEGSVLIIKDMELPDGSPGGLIDYDYFECPDWMYVGTSGVCIRNSYVPKATTPWSLTVDEYFSFSSHSSEEYRYPDYPAFTERFTAILRIPVGEEEEEIMDTVYLTC